MSFLKNGPVREASRVTTAEVQAAYVGHFCCFVCDFKNVKDVVCIRGFLHCRDDCWAKLFDQEENTQNETKYPLNVKTAVYIRCIKTTAAMFTSRTNVKFDSRSEGLTVTEK